VVSRATDVTIITAIGNLGGFTGFMSEQNGDKARFGRLRKQKIARRQATRDLRSRLFQAQQAKPAQQSPPAAPQQKSPPATPQTVAKRVARPAVERTGKTGGTGASVGSSQKKQK